MDFIRCVVERITYRNEENGYTVLKTKVKNYADLVTVVGNMVDVNVGSVLSVQGEWKHDTKYGRQFLAVKWEETLPATAYGIEKYLGSGLIKGVGPKFAKRIVNQFKEDTLAVIEADADRLIEVDGIGKKRVERIKQGWEQQKEIKNIMIFLQSHQVSTAHSAKIYKTYGNEAIKIVSENPYRLADDIWGIGFKTADAIAVNLGFEKNGFFRCRCGILYTLNRIAEEGHCFAEREQLIETGIELLDIEESVIVMTLDHMRKEADLIVEEERYYLPAYYYAEVGTARRIHRLMQQPLHKTPLQIEAAITGVQQVQKMAYDPIQMEAIKRAAASKVMILTGGPGTGKTTTTTGILAVMELLGYEILLAAPTGRAAKRLSEATGREAKTIHRLLEFKPPAGYQKNEEEPLKGDVLLVDECSMVDLMLMFQLLKAIPEGMILLLVGDVDQIPSVGAGNVLKDLIESGEIPVVKLERIFRQAAGSRIITNAHLINQGKQPDLHLDHQSDFFFIDSEDPDQTVAMIVKYCRRNLPLYYHADPFKEIQVLAPMQRGIVGTVNLNQQLQNALNNNTNFLKRGGVEYRQGDKVMQIKNNYDKEVFNGDIGFISAVDQEEQELKVLFDDRQVVYDSTELDELMLAYAVTIHKAQGSEYPIVVIPVLMNHYVMLQRNLIYTAITRAKKILVLIGSRKALKYAVNHISVNQRNTRLTERLQEIRMDSDLQLWN